MEFVGRFLTKLRFLLRRHRFTHDLNEEMAFHREQVENELQSQGMSADEARHAANRRFGNTTRLKEQSHEAISFRMENLWQDFRYALRQFRKNPGFALTVVLTMTLGIGATSIIFTLIDSTLLRSLPYPESERILRIEDLRLKGRSTGGLMSVPRFFDLQSRSKSFSSMAFFYFDHGALVAPGHLPIPIKAVSVSGDFWKVLETNPLMGRTFDENEARPGSPDSVVLSYHLWQDLFAGDPTILGKQILYEERPATILGIMPSSFRMPGGVDLWRTQHFSALQFDSYRGDGTRFINVYARLNSGVSLQAAQEELRTIGEQLRREYPASDASWQFHSLTLRDYLYGALRPALLAMFLASGLLLLIACINVANLLLSRGTAREREIALRHALGASTSRIRLQLLTESTFLSLLGAVLGLGITILLVHSLATKLPGRLGAPGVIVVHWPVIFFAFAMALLTGIAFGIAPGLRGNTPDLNLRLKHGEGRVAGASHDRLRTLLVSVQVGLSLVLLIGATFLAESLWNLLQSPMGFETDHRLTFSIDLPWSAQKDRAVTFYNEMQQRLENLPGVISVGQIDSLPTVDWHLRSGFDADWLPQIAGQPAINAEDRHIAGNYLQAMAIPLLAGRMFTEQDSRSEQIPIIINQQLVQQYLPGGNPIGRHLIVNSKSFEIVGVIANVRGTGGNLTDAAGPEVYWPADPDGIGRRYFVVRTQVPPQQLVSAIREQVHQVDPMQAVGNVHTLDDLISESVASPRLNALLVGSFAAIALILACIGIYGVVAYSVAQKTQEIGVRMALGATRIKIASLFLRRVLLAAGIGIIGGLTIALAGMRYLEGQLYGIRPYSIPAYAIALVLILIPVLIATLRPALLASSVDPVRALRNE